MVIFFYISAILQIYSSANTMFETLFFLVYTHNSWDYCSLENDTLFFLIEEPQEPLKYKVFFHLTLNISIEI